MKTRAYLLHALSPLHAGTGQSVDVIDLPIARMRATGMPYVPGSSVKGVLRDASTNHQDKVTTQVIYGPETNPEDDERHAGAIMVGDARLLALPLRSFKGTFAWVTSPLLLTLASRDMREGDFTVPDVPRITETGAWVASKSKAKNVHNGKIYLEDIDLNVKEDPKVGAWAKLIAELVSPEHSEMVSQRFIVVDDESMTFFWETGTQIETRIRLDSTTRVVAKRALWMEECLPPESILIGLMAAERSRHRDHPMQAQEVMNAALGQPRTLQFGGKATVGRGRCCIIPVKKEVTQ